MVAEIKNILQSMHRYASAKSLDISLLNPSSCDNPNEAKHIFDSGDDDNSDDSMTENKENEEYCIVPNPDNSGYSDSEDCSNDEFSNDDEIVFLNVSYKSVTERNTAVQEKLEPDHIYSWIDGEKIHSGDLNDNLLLSDKHFL